MGGAAPLVCRGRNVREMRTSTPWWISVRFLLVGIVERIAEGIGVRQ
jgi:hypothetical protein